MKQGNPGIRVIEAYRGPSLLEWGYALALSFLIATNLQTRRLMDDPQTGARYYSELPWVMPLQNLGMALNLAVLAVCLFWIVRPTGRRAYLPILAGVALVGALLGWAELYRALNVGDNVVFRLHELPFRPVHNMGLLGPQAHLSYLILRAPGGQTTPGRSWLVRLGLCLCLALAQFAVWDRLVR